MNKNKLLLDVVNNLRALADSIQVLCEASVAKEEIDSTKVEEVGETKPQITLEIIRAVLAEKSQEGKTDKVRELINKYGTNRLSEISSEHYADILKEAEVM